MKSRVLWLLCFLLVVSVSLSAHLERRAAIDVGSGNTKIIIADVDVESNVINEIYLESSFPVAYQDALNNSPAGIFDDQIIQKAVVTMQQIAQKLDELKVENYKAIATSAFRKSNNSKEVIDLIQQESGIRIEVIPQKEEGEIAFYSALGAYPADPHDVIVWDIGTGSMQLTVASDQQQLLVYMGEHMGAIAFRDYVIDVIQEKESSSTPNPISEQDRKEADKYARAFGRKAFQAIKDKIKAKVAVLGIGRLFYNSVFPIAAEGNSITRDGLREYIRNSLDKSDAELNNPFAHVDVTNCILVLGIMKALHIQSIQPLETTSTRGILIHPLYWSEAITSSVGS